MKNHSFPQMAAELQPKPPTADTVLFQTSSFHGLFTVPRELLHAIPGTWFADTFPMHKPARVLPVYYDKQSRPVYQIFVPSDVFEAFLEILQLPDLLKGYLYELPKCCDYKRPLKVWQLYLTEYFHVDIPLETGGKLMGKRAREEEKEEEARDFSRPPKRFKRDYHDWEVLIALFEYIFEKHPDEDAFQEGTQSTLHCLFGPKASIPWKEHGERPVTADDFIEKKPDALKKAAERVLNAHFDLEVAVKTFEFGLVRALTSGYNGALRNGITRDYWPDNSPGFDDTVLVIVLEWKEWDGKSM
jgi:hypothetical protein